MRRQDDVSDSAMRAPWDSHVLAELIDELMAIRTGCIDMESAFQADLGDQHPSYPASARNLLHYLALRRLDIREVQKRLASLGLSSLGRTESHVLDNLTAVLCARRRTCRSSGPPRCSRSSPRPGRRHVQRSRTPRWASGPSA